MYSILLIGDSLDYATLIEKTLGSKYRLDKAATVASARTFATQNQYDLILLDIVLPDGNGFEFCTELKAMVNHKTTPIVVLTGRGDVPDRVMGWSLGADDYIVKPFAPLEFQARIQSRIDNNREKMNSGGVMRWESLEIDSSFHEARLKEDGQTRKLDLTLIEFKILTLLVKNRERVMSRGQIIEAAWGMNANVGERTVDKHMSVLRKKMGSKTLTIGTVSGIGYRLVKKAAHGAAA